MNELIARYAPLLLQGLEETLYMTIFSTVLSYVFGTIGGLAGILWASVFARAFSYEFIDPVIIYKRVFNKNSLKYFAMYAAYLGLVLVDGYISYLVVKLIPFEGIVGFAVKAVVLSIVYNIVFFLATVRTPEFSSLLVRVKNKEKRSGR